MSGLFGSQWGSLLEDARDPGLPGAAHDQVDDAVLVVFERAGTVREVVSLALPIRPELLVGRRAAPAPAPPLSPCMVGIEGRITPITNIKD